MKIRYFIPFFVYFGCNYTDLPDIHNLNDGKIDVIGHGGSGFQAFDNPYPANSFTSIKRAIDGMNADGFEVDVQLSSDSVLVLYHDRRLESLTDGEGFVYERDADYLLNCRYRNDFNVNITMNEKIISLEKIISYFKDYTPKPIIYLDIKLYNSKTEYSIRLIHHLTTLVDKYNAQEYIIIQSNSLDFLTATITTDSSLQIYLKGPYKKTTVQNVLNNNFKGVMANFESIAANDIMELHENGIYVALYGGRSRNSLTKAIEKSPDAVQTDNIHLLQSLIY